MATIGGGRSVPPGSRNGQRSEGANPDVEEMLHNLNLTAEEGEVAAWSDDEENAEWAIVGKVLSPMTLHASTILRAMKLAWGNPYGLKIRSIGDKGHNLFVAEFGSAQEMGRAQGGSPWMIGKHAVILQLYDASLKPTDIAFDKMEMWVRILNLPLGWMNAQRGVRAMELVGEVVKMDVDDNGKASGPYLRARIRVEISKPLRRGIMLKPSMTGKAEWFDIQYEKLPFYYFSCGIMGHTEVECDSPTTRNALGKLPYDVKLRAPEERRRRIQSFAQAAEESYGSGSSTNTRHSRTSGNRNEGKKPIPRQEKKDQGDKYEEVESPPKEQQDPKGKKTHTSEVNAAGRQLFREGDNTGLKPVRKRKTKAHGSVPEHLLDINPTTDAMVVVPRGLVQSRLHQMGPVQEGQDDATEEMLKKQKVTNTQNAQSATAASVSPCRAQ